MSELVIVVARKPVANYFGCAMGSLSSQPVEAIRLEAYYPWINKACAVADWIIRNFGFRVNGISLEPSRSEPRTPCKVLISLRRADGGESSQEA